MRVAWLASLPISEIERVTYVWERDVEHGLTRGRTSLDTFREWSRTVESLEAISAGRSRAFNVSDAGTPERLPALAYAGDFFGVMGIDLALGRAPIFDEATDCLGGGGQEQSGVRRVRTQSKHPLQLDRVEQRGKRSRDWGKRRRGCKYDPRENQIGRFARNSDAHAALVHGNPLQPESYVWLVRRGDQARADRRWGDRQVAAQDRVCLDLGAGADGVHEAV